MSSLRSIALLALAVLGGCQNERREYQLAVAEARQEGSEARTEAWAFSGDQQGEHLRALFGPDQTALTSGWVNVCKLYFTSLEMKDAMSAASDAEWQAAGISKTDAEQKFKRVALSFAEEIEKIMALPEEERAKLDKPWAHPCDGRLEPANTTALIRALEEVGVSMPAMSEEG